MYRDIELDLRQSHTWPVLRTAIDAAGGFPCVLLPLDGAHKAVVAQGRLCRDRFELARAVGWAFGLSPEQRIRLIPVEPAQSEVEFR